MIVMKDWKRWGWGEDENDEREIRIRIAMGWARSNRYKILIRSDVGMERKKLWSSVVLPVITYECEMWLMSKEVDYRMRVAKIRMIRTR